MKQSLLFLSFVIIILAGCRKENEITPPAETEIEEPGSHAEVKGFYLLNEGLMGSNQSTLDFFNTETSIYSENIFAAANPDAVEGLGGIGNDIKIYGSKLYVVLNGSNKIEVMNAGTVKRLGHIEIANARYLAFHKNRGYISSYAGPIGGSFTDQKGEVIEFDTATLAITRRVTVGYQPEEIAIAGEKLFVANSGGYQATYDHTVSVINLSSFTEEKKIDVAVNLHRLRKAANGKIYVSSRGNYGDIPSRLFVIDPALEKVTDTIFYPVGNMAVHGDSAYIISTEWTLTGPVDSYYLINLTTRQAEPGGFITDGTNNDITGAYGIAIHPITNDIYVTDAVDYTRPGKLFAFDKNGKKKWSITTGDIPAHITFQYKD